MGNIAKGRQKVGVVIDDDIAAAIAARARSLGIKPSRYAAMVLERWRDQGFPPVSEPDRLLQSSKPQGKPHGRQSA